MNKYKELIYMKFTIIKFTLLLFFGTLNTNAQNVTVNPGAGSYASLQSAFEAINNGTHSGVVTVSITANTIETVSAVLNASGSGSASYTSVDIYPTVSGLTISGNLSTPLIDLNGADNVTIDGRLNGSGSTIDLTITNTNATNVTSTIRFINDATSNIVKYCTLKGAPIQANTVVPVSGIINISTAGISGNNNIVISNNNITNSGSRPQCAIFASGTSGKDNSGVIIRENNFYDIIQTSGGNKPTRLLYIIDGNTDFQILDNSFYETANLNPGNTSFQVISITNILGNNFSVSGNYIGGKQPLCQGGALTKTYGHDGFNCIYMKVGKTIASNIQGNTINNWDYSNIPNSRDWFGIFVDDGSVNIGTTTGNTIGAATSSEGIKVNNCPTLCAISVAGSGILNIKNNIIGSLTNTTASNIQCISASVTGTLTIENNTIGSTSTANSIYASHISNTGIWGINVNSTGGTTVIKGNTISNISSNATASSTLTGINYSGSTNSVAISGNFLRDVSFINAASIGSLTGINLVAGTNSTFNNIISLGNNNPGLIYGIATAGGTNKIYFNTVYLSGTPTSGAYNSSAIYSSAANDRDIRNNIFFNARTNNSGATGNHYAAYFGAAGTGLTLDYNDYFVSGSGGLLGYYNSTPINTLADWKANTTKDLRSQSINPSLSNAGGTLSSNYLPSETTLVAASGTSIDADFVAVLRSATAPSIGAFEYAVNGCFDPLLGGTIGTAQSICNGTSALLTNISLPSDQMGTLEYKWQYSTTDASSGFVDIPSSNFEIYTSGSLTINTWFKRLARVSCSSNWSGTVESNVILITVKTDPGLGNFAALNKTYFDGSFTIPHPSTSSIGAITYNSSNTSVATISGTTVTIVSAGTSNITATQEATSSYCDVSISALLTVNSVTVVTKQGEMTSTNVNYVNKFGALNALEGLDSNGKVITAKTIVSVGESYGGGIVAYILQAGDPGYDARVQHGLIATTADLSSSARWTSGEIPFSGGAAIAIGTGNQNTIDIVAGDATTGLAARLCYDLVQGGYSDWYLPSRNELSKLWLNRTAIGGFTQNNYWSSTKHPLIEPQFPGKYAWYVSFFISDNGGVGYHFTTTTFAVRAVRSF